MTAGVAVGLVALPLAMAFAIASGMSPQSGIYTAVVAGILISLLGGSRVQIGGPTGITAIDATGLRAFEELAKTLEAAGRRLILCGARHQPAALIARAEFHRHLGDRNICKSVEEALRRLAEIHADAASRHTASAP